MGITDFDRIYGRNDLATGDSMFAATGVTDGDMLDGVRSFPGGVITELIVMRSKTRHGVPRRRSAPRSTAVISAAEPPHAAQHGAVGDAGGGEHDVARRQVVQLVYRGGDR